MPSKTLRQHNLMAMVANNPKAAKRIGIPQSVGEEYMKADKGLRLSRAGEDRPDRQKINRSKTNHGKSILLGNGGSIMKKLFKGRESYSEELKEARAIKAGKITPEQYARGEKMEDAKKKTKKMADGGMTDEDRAKRYREEATRTTPTPKEQEEMRQQAADRRQIEVQKQKNAKPMQYKSGGMVCRGDGIAQRGKTRGRLV